MACSPRDMGTYDVQLLKRSWMEPILKFTSILVKNKLNFRLIKYSLFFATT